jgi:DNA invertase Pin-like site-specific DNA recombinase
LISTSTNNQSTPTTPAGKLMLQMCGAFAEFERSMLQARIQAGLRRAVANGRTLGRPLNDPDAIGRARGELAKGIGINRVAKLVGLSNGTVQRIKAGMEGIVMPSPLLIRLIHYRSEVSCFIQM